MVLRICRARRWNLEWKKNGRGDSENLWMVMNGDESKHWIIVLRFALVKRWAFSFESNDPDIFLPLLFLLYSLSFANYVFIFSSIFCLGSCLRCCGFAHGVEWVMKLGWRRVEFVEGWRWAREFVMHLKVVEGWLRVEKMLKCDWEWRSWLEVEGFYRVFETQMQMKIIFS